MSQHRFPVLNEALTFGYHQNLVSDGNCIIQVAAVGEVPSISDVFHSPPHLSELIRYELVAILKNSGVAVFVPENKQVNEARPHEIAYIDFRYVVSFSLVPYDQEYHFHRWDSHHPSGGPSPVILLSEPYDTTHIAMIAGLKNDPELDHVRELKEWIESWQS